MDAIILRDYIVELILKEISGLTYYKLMNDLKLGKLKLKADKIINESKSLYSINGNCLYEVYDTIYTLSYDKYIFKFKDLIGDIYFDPYVYQQKYMEQAYKFLK